MANKMNLKVGLMFAACLLIAGCSFQPMKPSTAHVQAAPPAPAGDIPEPVRVASILPKPKPSERPETYSVVVNNVAVRELLFALARDAKLNIDVHPGIQGSVTLNAIDQTLLQLLTRIGKQVDIRWEFDGSNLVVMPDSRFVRMYKIDYVNMERTVQTNVTISSAFAGSGAAGGGSSGASNSSGTSIQIKSSNLFWDTLVKTIDKLMQDEDKLVAERAQLAAQNAAARASTAAQGAAVPGAAADGPTAGSSAASAGSQPAQAPPTAQPQASSSRETTHVIANPDAGVLIVRATSRVHERVQAYLDQVLSRSKRQVLIEATIAEVALNNSYQRGIDWTLLKRGPAGISFTQAAAGPSTQAAVDSSFFVGALADPVNRLGNISATLKLLESFGNVRVLSSPRISVLNNQTAVLKVTDEIVYFTMKADTTAVANAGTVTNFTTTAVPVPIGFVMNVTPQIDEAGNVLLNLKPTISRILRFVNDPNPSLAAANVTNPVPEIQRREMESIMRLSSGQTGVLGGLIQDSLTDNEDGVPGLTRSGGIGPFFGRRTAANKKTELVVFVRATVINDASMDGDYRGYRVLLPDDNFLSTPNLGKAVTDLTHGSTQ